MLRGDNNTEPSDATAFSQVLLAPKPHTDPKQWRMCIDYRRLNALTEAESWLLSNTEHMFERIRCTSWFPVSNLQNLCR